MLYITKYTNPIINPLPFESSIPSVLAFSNDAPYLVSNNILWYIISWCMHAWCIVSENMVFGPLSLRAWCSVNVSFSSCSVVQLRWLDKGTLRLRTVQAPFSLFQMQRLFGRVSRLRLQHHRLRRIVAALLPCHLISAWHGWPRHR